MVCTKIPALARYTLRDPSEACLCGQAMGRPPAFCRATYRRRNVGERLVGWLREHRRIATRSEKLANGFLAMVMLSFMLLYFRMLKRFSDST
jgi:transposase